MAAFAPGTAEFSGARAGVSSRPPAPEAADGGATLASSGTGSDGACAGLVLESICISLSDIACNKTIFFGYGSLIVFSAVRDDLLAILFRSWNGY